MRRDRLAQRAAPRDAASRQDGAARGAADFRPDLRAAHPPLSPDSAVAKIWHALRAGSIVVASTSTDDPEDLAVFAQELASRLRVFKLILLDRGGGLTDEHGERMSFVEAQTLRARTTARVDQAAP